MFHEMTLKLYFMKCLERKISQCILPLINANILKAVFFIRKNIEKLEKNKDSTRKATGLVSSAKLLEHYSSNIDIQNVNQL